ncbi:hypothetical protein B0H21DRAFT_779324 [Amylocystis lapponica]|nr:hypothetical protein B0H21DRAFT_779324 [Amylocystis lapponica]
MDLSREETLAILSSMGIELPPRTKLPDEALAKRLKQAINAAQCLSTVVPDAHVDPATIRRWPTEGENRSVYAAIRRGDLHEAAATAHARALGRDQAVDLYTNAFMDLRQTLMGIAVAWDEGRTWGVIQDPQHETCAITFRIVSVHELDAHTPLIVILYHSFTRENMSSGIRWIERRMAEADGVPNINATALEQKLLLRLLAHNAKPSPQISSPPRSPRSRPSNRGETYATTINRFNMNASALDRVQAAYDPAPPANMHGTRVFLVKLQIGVVGGIVNMLIHDRQRSFDAYFEETRAPAVFAAFKAEMQGPRGGRLGRKMYRWAKRESDWAFSVCLDRAPDTEIMW